jgi:hypothetical protein
MERKQGSQQESGTCRDHRRYQQAAFIRLVLGGLSISSQFCPAARTEQWPNHLADYVFSRQSPKP